MFKGKCARCSEETVAEWLIFPLYTFFLRQLVYVAGWFSPKMRQFRTSRRERPWQAPAADERPVVWFHSASQGELEAILPILKRIESGRIPIRVIVTAFSPSALGRLERLRSEFPRLAFAHVGPSPFEGEWERAFGSFRPEIFVTYKYDAWPDLWRALGKLRISTAVLSAVARPSLAVVARLAEWRFLRLPPLFFFCVTEEARAGVSHLFPGMGEPMLSPELRWDRQADLETTGPAFDPNSAHELTVVLGSIYTEDLDVVFPPERMDEIANAPLDARFVIFPHRLDEDNVRKIRARVAGLPIRAEVVALPGKLAPFYREADLAWVGGGFHHGIHSTIQPAFRGLPIFCGPMNVDDFPETALLRSSGQLRVCRDSADALAFWERIAGWDAPSEAKLRQSRIAELRGQLGGADRFIEWMLKKQLRLKARSEG